MFAMIFNAIGGTRIVLYVLGALAVGFILWWIQDTIRDLERNNAILQGNQLVMEQALRDATEAYETLGKQHIIDLNTIQNLHKTKTVLDRRNQKLIEALDNVPQPKACERDPAIDILLNELRSARVSPSTNN